MGRPKFAIDAEVKTSGASIYECLNQARDRRCHNDCCEDHRDHPSQQAALDERNVSLQFGPKIGEVGFGGELLVSILGAVIVPFSTGFKGHTETPQKLEIVLIS